MPARARSLLAKFLIVVVPIVVVCSAAASGISTYLNAKDLQRQLGQEMMNVAATQSVALAMPLWNYQTENTQHIVDALLVNPNISAASVSDNFQVVIASGEKPAAGRESWTINVPILSPVQGETAYIGRLSITYDDAQIDRSVRERLASDGFLLLALILALSGGVALAHALVIGHPLGRFVRAIREAEDPNLRRAVMVTTHDEIGAIMAAYNRLLARLGEEEEERRRATDALRIERDRAEDALRELKAAQANLIQAEKLAALGALVSGIAHEMNTPVGNALVSATFLADEAAKVEAKLDGKALTGAALRSFLSSARQASGHVVEGCTRAAELVRSFKMVAADHGEQDRRLVPLSTLVEEVIAAAPPRVAAGCHDIAVDVPAGLGLVTYPGLLREVVSALLSNAVTHAYPSGTAGRIVIGARALDAERLVLEVADQGCGIPAAMLPRIFDPFFTTDRSSGAGIGLHFVHNAVTRTLGGRIEADSREGEGTRFRLILPRRPV